MFISNIDFKNFKGIRVAHITFNEVVNKITGKNWAGKSTILDAIRTAIVGKAYLGKWTSAEKLITTWENASEIKLKLKDSDRVISITRKIDAKGTMSLDVIDSNADRLLQSDLDALISEFSIDPLEFTEKTNKEQFEIIKQITWCDTSELEDKISSVYEKRTIANGILTKEKGALESIWKPELVERVDVSTLMTELRSIQAANENINAQKNKLKAAEDKVAMLKENEARLMRELDIVRWEINRGMEFCTWLEGEISKLEVKDESELIAKINSADEINKKANEFDRYQSQLKVVQDAEVSYIKLDTEIKNLREQKDEMIKSANMPLDNMEFNEKDGIIINWLPFSQYSTAQQIIMASKIATFTNPALKVISIKNGSLLDDDSIKEIEDFAEKEWYQVFLEIVNEWLIDSIIIKNWEVISSSDL